MTKRMPFDFLLDYLPVSVVIKPAVALCELISRRDKRMGKQHPRQLG